MKPDQARQQAEECRMAAGMLFAIAIAAVIAGGCVWYSMGPGPLLLACMVVALVCGLGFFHELAEGTRFDRQARQLQPLGYENHGHE
jgi:hypothetical protein